MNISEATKLVIATGGKMYRVSEDCAPMLITPTDTPDCCTGEIRGSDKAPGKRWQPQAKDLIAEDWEVTE